MTEGEIKSDDIEPVRWDYDTHFRQYLLLLGAKGKDALETTGNFPSNIGLSAAWHDTHINMRDGTLKDGKERLVIVGYKEDQHLALPINPVEGMETHVPYNLLARELQKARERHAILDLVGQIHTHPDNSPFSPSDLFTLLYEPFEPEIAKLLPKEGSPVAHYFAGLVTSETVIYAFKTRETHPVRAFDTWPKKPSEVFVKYWYEKAGYELLRVGSSESIRRLRPDANKWDANFGIAEAHNLALYQGKIGKDLTRIYPE